MTKREICERLLEIREYAKAASNWDEDTTSKDFREGMKHIAFDAKNLLLDLVAPETEGEKEVAFRERCRAVFGDLAAPEEEKEAPPGVIAKPGKDGAIEWCWCQKCYAHAAVVHDPFGDGEDWSYFKKCGVSFRLKRRAEEEQKKEPPVLIYEEKGEKTTCPACGAPALPIKNTQGVFYCKRCEGFFNCPEEGNEGRNDNPVLARAGRANSPLAFALGQKILGQKIRQSMPFLLNTKKPEDR